MLEALIFDVDGTLAETERDGHRVAFNRAFADVGLRWYWDTTTYARLVSITGSRERLRHWVHTRAQPAPTSFGGEDLLAELHRRKTEHYARMVRAGGLRARPGVLRLVEQARACGVRLAVASTGSRENVEAVLEAWHGAGWRGVFDVVAAGDVVPRRKPDPGVYRWVVEHLGLPAGDCVAIEDSASGLAAARGAGVDVVVARSEYSRGQRFDGALAVLDDLGEPDAPSRGWACGDAWSGVVDVATIDAWRERLHRARRPVRAVPRLAALA
jgi:HAD superfamily hydrolase (TIGR01509 family)